MHLFAIILLPLSRRYKVSRQKCGKYNSVFKILFSSEGPFKWLYGVYYDNIFNLDGGEPRTCT